VLDGVKPGITPSARPIMYAIIRRVNGVLGPKYRPGLQALWSGKDPPQLRRNGGRRRGADLTPVSGPVEGEIKCQFAKAVY
jgi:hypothetical protein